MTTMRRLTAVIFGALIWSVASSVALACPVCFQMDESPVTEGVRTAVFVLMGVTVCVLGAFGSFVLRIARGAQNLPEPSGTIRNPPEPS